MSEYSLDSSYQSSSEAVRIEAGSSRKTDREPSSDKNAAKQGNDYSNSGSAPRYGNMYSLHRSFERNQTAIYSTKMDPKGNREPDPKHRSPPQSNLMFYAIIGYISGIVLILLWYLFNYRKEREELNLKWFCIVLLGLLLLIIIYSRATQSIGVLCLVSIFGYTGRELFISLALLLAVLGPVTNILGNMEIMAYSLSCGQTLLSAALTPMHEIMGSPVYVVEQAVYTCLSQVRKLMDRLDRALRSIEELIWQLYSGYKSCDQWLLHQQSFFEHQVGSPYDRCMGAGMISVQDCKAKFKKQPSVCALEKHIEWFCSNLKDLPSFFDVSLKEQQQIVDQVFSRPMEMFGKIRALFEVSITFDHSPKSDENSGASGSDIGQNIAADFDRHIFLFIYIWLAAVLALLIGLLVLHSIYFHVNYLDSNHYRNYYLTKEFFDINKEKPTGLTENLLPLRPTERKTFVGLDSWRLLPSETRHANASIVLLLIISFQLFTICVFDYGLSWMLANLTYHLHKTAELEPPEYTKVVIKRGGFIADLLRDLVQAFEPLTKNLIVDIQHCLPLPRPPKFLRYWEIMMLCLLAWILIIGEPISHRVGHKVMSTFYPANGRRRAVLLHERLSYGRVVFIRRVRCRSQLLNFYVPDNCKCLTQFIAMMSGALYRLTKGYLGAYQGKYCLLCKSRLIYGSFVVCKTPNCRGIYCELCFLDLDSECLVCSLRIRFDDVVNITDVEDSSDAECARKAPPPDRSYANY
ncbi:DC-STAMP domain-containing protein 2 isoform X2 [Drosophila mojavensis]|uniref:Uncharacterized protein, isoform D n=1 Tax=Drosophila mojavensis TaxID=7230 RepID=A0A0Q9XGP5_DROMO|nr:DC-STAMP domain-containing protein 2 isoform X2 [Drosophila mojavensis]KRG07663.1 uncharacterized protein Dmoj_GI16755, isoform D [Drosophila mojavensis]